VKLSKKDWGLAWTEEGWNKTKRYLDGFLGIADKYRFKFMVICFPITPQIYADDNDAFMFLPQDRLKEYCEAHKIILVDFLPYFRKYKEEEIFFDAGHHTLKGYELITQKIYDSIKNDLPER